MRGSAIKLKGAGLSTWASLFSWYNFQDVVDRGGAWERIFRSAQGDTKRFLHRYATPLTICASFDFVAALPLDRLMVEYPS